MVDWGFAERGLHRISSQADVRNRRSWRVMEKVGMRREGLFRSHRKDPRPGYPRIDVVLLQPAAGGVGSGCLRYAEGE